jgi:hypothetical protein
MIRDHMIVEKISKKKFTSMLSKVKPKDIEITSHALFRLNEKQRKIFEGDILKDFILKEEPVEIGKQQNGNFAAIYNYVQGKLLKILLRFSSKKIYIVTFYILNKEQEQKVGK